MKAHRLGGWVALLALVSAAGHVAAEGAKTVSARILDTSLPGGGKVQVSVSAGEGQGVMPGDQGYFVKDGQRVSRNGDFEISRIYSRRSTAMSGFSDRSLLDGLTSVISTSRRCAARGATPNFGSKEVASGQKPPPGFAFATVIATSERTEGSFTFTIDKGTDDRVMPSSSAYVLMPGLGTPAPFKVDIDWASKTHAGGTITGIQGTEQARKLGFELASCSR